MENPNPSQRPGQIHVQVEGSKVKYYFDPIEKLFFDKNTGKLAPRYIMDLLEDRLFVKKLNEGLTKYLGIDKFTY